MDSRQNELWVSRLTSSQLKMKMWCQNIIWFIFNSITIILLWYISTSYSSEELSILWPFFEKSFTFSEVKVVRVLHIVVPSIITLGVISLLLLCFMESCDPYTATDGFCTDDDSCNYSGAKVTGVYSSWSPNEPDMKEMVYLNPVGTAIYASYMFDYGGGIYDDDRCCEGANGCDVNHGVAVIGYGSEGGKDYWLIKNSWGTSWGESGFIRFKRGTGHCAVGTDRVAQPYCGAA